MAEDILSLLLPEATGAERAEVRRVVTALRLVRDDARLRVAQRAEPSWWSARRELERLERRQRWRAVEALLHAYLAALRPADSFLELGEPTLDCASAWRTLLVDATPAQGFPPAPLESPLAVIERLLAAGVAHGASPAWRTLWAARARHVVASPVEAERHWNAALRASRTAGEPAPLQARLVAGVAAARLDRFTPARALELLDTHTGLIAIEPALRRLLGWSALLCGRLDQAGILLAPAVQPGTRLPRPLVELRADVPEWAHLLRGADARSPSATGEGGLGRRALGALLLGVFEHVPGGGARILELDLPRRLRGGAERRLAVRGESTPRAACGEVQRFHLRGSAARELVGALAGERARSMALTGLADAAGRAAGWIQLESEHHLLPSGPRLLALGRAWSQTLKSTRMRLPLAHRVVAPDWLPFAASDPRETFVQRLLERLEIGAGRSACWIERDQHRTDRIRARSAPRQGSRELGLAASRAVQTVQARLEPTSYEESAARGGGTVAGVALPLTDSAGQRVLGVLVLEGERRELLDERLLGSARASLRALEGLWWTSAFRAHSLARSGNDLAWDPTRRFLCSLEPALCAAAAARAPLLLVGSSGSGRRTLARWLHFRGPASERELHEGPEARGGGTCILDLESLGSAQQLELARSVSQGGPERILLLAQAPTHVLRERGRLSSELERCLDPLSLCVPALRERRDEIPELVTVLAGNAARRTRTAGVRFSDEALGHLWRQEWRGGVAELASLVTQLVHAHPARVVSGEDVRAAFGARRLEFRERLPSRRPRALDLEVALECTRHRVGSHNHARAARYLGWDPETLEARLRELAPVTSDRAGLRKRKRGSGKPPSDADLAAW